MKRIILCVALALAGCATTRLPAPEAQVRVEKVEIAVPVPCKALAELGPEPAFPDTPEAIERAATIGELAALYAQGRAMRVQRLAAYAVAKATCVF